MLLMQRPIYAGTKSVIDHATSPGSGTVEVKANATRKVSLDISDSGSNNLVSNTGIDFGDVDAEGTLSSSGLTGTAIDGDTAEYKTSFDFAVSRTGNGNVTLAVSRTAAGSFSATDGIRVEDSAGALQSLAGSGNTVTLISNQAEGTFSKQLGVRIHGADSGALTSTLTFTATAL